MAITKLDLTKAVSGTMPVGNGGTGVTSAADLANTGNMVKLNSVTTTDATISTITFDSTYINSTYDRYFIIGRVRMNTDGASTRMRFSESGTFQSGASYYGLGYNDDSGSGTNDNDRNDLVVTQIIGNASGEGGSFTLYLDSFNSTTIPSSGMWNSSTRSNAGFHGLNVGSGIVNNGNAHDGVRFFPSTGYFASDTSLTLYGVKE